MQPSEKQYLEHLLNATTVPTHAPAAAVEHSSPAALTNDDQIYLKIWEIEQAHVNSRWTVATFFLSVSFAIFGFSFQAQLTQPLPQIARISGLVIYWFAYVLFTRFNLYTELLRTYMYEMETTKRTQVSIQTRARQLMRTRVRWQLSATRLLLYFGILYALGVGLLWWLQF